MTEQEMLTHARVWNTATEELSKTADKATNPEISAALIGALAVANAVACGWLTEMNKQYPKGARND